MMEAVQTFEMLVNSYLSTWRFNPEASHLERVLERLNPITFLTLSISTNEVSDDGRMR
jgi:hypothetical protein